MPAARYGRLSISLHWLMLGVIAALYLFIELRVLFERGSAGRDFMREAHFGCGLLVLCLVVLRIAARWLGGTPPITPALPAWQRFASTAVQVLLYAFMIAMPLAGWTLLSLRGDPVPFFGLELPPLAAPDEALSKELRGWHGLAGRIGYALIGLHAAAALFHHYVRKDDTLRRMGLRWALRPALVSARDQVSGGTASNRPNRRPPFHGRSRHGAWQAPDAVTIGPIDWSRPSAAPRATTRRYTASLQAARLAEFKLPSEGRPGWVARARESARRG